MAPAFFTASNRGMKGRVDDKNDEKGNDEEDRYPTLFDFSPSPSVRRRRNSPAFSENSEPSNKFTSPESITSVSSTSALLKMDEEESNSGPNRLHYFCRSATSMADLESAIGHVSVATASSADRQGQIALHILSNNRPLANATLKHRHSFARLSGAGNNTPASRRDLSRPKLFSESDRHISITSSSSTLLSGKASSHEDDLKYFVVNVLLNAYPAAMMTTDHEGYIPFESALREWVEFSYIQPRRHRTTQSISSVHQLSILPSLWELKGSMQSRWANGNYQHQRNSKTSINTHAASTTVGSAKVADVEAGHASKRKEEERNLIFPIRQKLSAHALFSIVMLSAILDSMEETRINCESSRSDSKAKRKRSRPTALDELQNITVQDLRDCIIESIASIPNLVKTVLFIEDGEQRKLCLESTLLRRVMTSTASVDTWLTGMLQSSERKPSRLALEYLHMISKASFDGDNTVSDKNGVGAKGFSISKSRDDFYQAVSRLNDFVPSLLSLNDGQIEEAATTKLVQQVLDRIISRPFAVTVVFCDAMFLALLITTYRGAINGVLLGASAESILNYIYMVNVGIFYFVIREIGKAISICMITRRGSENYFISFWNVSDMLMTVLALASTISMRGNFSGIRTLCAVTTGFMWIRVLSFLKGINMQLATFVLAILQITRDILWFCVILFIVVVLFSQMFFTLLAPEQCLVSETRDSKECAQSEYYLKVYAILLGDFGLFSRDSFISVFSTFLAVLYTFMVVIVLLNVLIAVASDSYEKCLIRSHKLFGRARVMMIAELVSFQNLLRRNSHPGHTNSPSASGELYTTWWSETSCFGGWNRGSVVFYSLSLIVIVAWTLGEVIGHLSGGVSSLWLSLGSICVNVCLFVGIIVFLQAGATVDGTNLKADDGDDSDSSSKLCGEWYGRHFQKTMVRLLGSSGGTTSNSENEMWKGRLLFLRSEISKIADETRRECADMVQSLDTLIQQSEGRMRNEFASVQEAVNGLYRERRNVDDSPTEEFLPLGRRPNMG